VYRCADDSAQPDVCGVRYQELTAINASCSRVIPKPARTFQDLLVWQKAHGFVLEVYAFTAMFPKQATYGLSLQMRRAAVSIPANIAEGFRRRGKADKARFLNMAEGSVEECRYFLILAKDLGYGDTQTLSVALEEVSRLLYAYRIAMLTSSTSGS
jgi:four helix bundle protein